MRKGLEHEARVLPGTDEAGGARRREQLGFELRALWMTTATVPPGDTGCPAAIGKVATRPPTGDSTNCTRRASASFMRCS
ncbi:MAG: hypothetical protein ACXU85_19450, partial [Xanthobacteraceae bacterium]